MLPAKQTFLMRVIYTRTETTAAPNGTTPFGDDGIGSRDGYAETHFDKFRYAAIADDAGPCSTVGV